MLLTFRNSTAYCKIINLLPLGSKSTLLCPAFCDILTIFHLPVGTMLSFVGRGSQRDIKGRRGSSFRFWVLCCFPEMLGCQELTGHPVASPQHVLPAPQRVKQFRQFQQHSSTQYPHKSRWHPIRWLPSEFTELSSQLLSQPNWHPHRWLLACLLYPVTTQWAIVTPSKDWISALAMEGRASSKFVPFLCTPPQP